MRLIVALAVVLAVGAAVNVLGLKDRERKQAAGQFAALFLDERDYYYGGSY